MSDLPLIPAAVIGSWSFPGWYAHFCDQVSRHPDRFGPDDREEALRDAVRLAVEDQLRAGADLVSDGEMRRVDFNLGFYDYLTGLEPLPQARRLAGAGTAVGAGSCRASRDCTRCGIQRALPTSSTSTSGSNGLRR